MKLIWKSKSPERYVFKPGSEIDTEIIKQHCTTSLTMSIAVNSNGSVEEIDISEINTVDINYATIDPLISSVSSICSTSATDGNSSSTIVEEVPLTEEIDAQAVNQEHAEVQDQSDAMSIASADSQSEWPQYADIGSNCVWEPDNRPNDSRH